MSMRLRALLGVWIVALLDLLDYLLWDWRRHNPDMVQVYSAHFSNFAVGRGKSAAEVLAAGGLFGNVGQAGQAIEEARLLTDEERRRRATNHPHRL